MTEKTSDTQPVFSAAQSLKRGAQSCRDMLRTDTKGVPQHWRDGVAILATFLERASSSQPESIDMILYCPTCGMQHVDAPDTEEATIDAAELGLTHGSRDWEDHIERHGWSNPPHRSHQCQGCGHIWRPADVPTNGVAVIKTKGSQDSATPATYRTSEGYQHLVEHYAKLKGAPMPWIKAVEALAVMYRLSPQEAQRLMALDL